MIETLYTKLEVPHDATTVEIKKAYRKLALRYHPDKNPGDAHASKRFQDIRKVYEMLSNPATRAEYDALLGLSPRTTKASSRRTFSRENQWEKSTVHREDEEAFRTRWTWKWPKINVWRTLRAMREGTDNAFEFYYLLGFILWLGYRMLCFIIEYGMKMSWNL